MLKKNYSQTGKTCRVTFKLPADVETSTAYVCGEFNNWDKSTNPMKKLRMAALVRPSASIQENRIDSATGSMVTGGKMIGRRKVTSQMNLEAKTQ